MKTTDSVETNFIEIINLMKDGHFAQAEPLIEKELSKELSRLSHTNNRHLDQLVRLVVWIVRVYTERNNSIGIQQLFIQLNQYPEILEKCRQDSVFLYTQGVLYFYLKDIEHSLQSCQRSLNIALEKGSLNEIGMSLILQAKIALAKGLSGLSLAQASMKELQNIVQQKNISAELKLSAYLLEADYLMMEGKSEVSVEKALSAYDLAKETECSAFFMSSIIAKVGYLYLQRNDKVKAMIYLQLAAKTLWPDSMVRLNQAVQNMIQQINTNTIEYDVLLDTKKRKVTLRPQLEVDLKHQFVLLDLLKLFVGNPGRPYNKQEIAEKVWEEPYNPQRHDNLIYVNLKRLRDILESGSTTKELLKRSRQGYFFSADYRLGFQEEDVQ